jgi:type III pantothenate kinase
MLLIDIGNSRMKWACAADGAWLQQGVASLAESGILMQSLAGFVPQRLLVSNVAGEAVAEEIRALAAAWDCPVEFVTARAKQCGVVNGYENPAQLGSDRWAALIAAWHREQAACLVVNCGTATTIDALSDAGEFLGGLILPGLEMMRQALTEGTAQLGMGEGVFREFPRNTQDAIQSGAMMAVIGAVRSQYAFLKAPAARCLLAGGAAEILLPHLGLPCVLVDNLVLKGLQIIAEETP